MAHIYGSGCSLTIAAMVGCITQVGHKVTYTSIKSSAKYKFSFKSATTTNKV